MPARAQDPQNDLKTLLALQNIVQTVIKDIEPTVACILVSRSDAHLHYSPSKKTSRPRQLGAAGQPGLSLENELDMSGPKYVPESFGSGVVVDEKGLILTNYHVVKDATKIFVRLPGFRGSYAEIHAADPRSDLAILRLSNSKRPLRTMPLGNASKCIPGQFILSIANPYAAGFRDGKPSASWGIISAIRRRQPGELFEVRSRNLRQYGTLLQTDARLNLGCSGGALVDLHGQMIGLTTALAAIQGGETPGGFAVPIDIGMRRIIDVLKRGEEVDYGFLGVEIDSFSQQTGDGVPIKGAMPGSPAQREARLMPGDAIIKVNDVPVHNSEELFHALGTHLAGTRVKLEVRRFTPSVGNLKRAGRRVLEVELAKLYVPGQKVVSSLGSRPYLRGLRVDHASVLALEKEMSMIPDGIWISEIQPSSPAASTTLKPGDIISRINGRPVHKPMDFYQLVAAAHGPVELTLASFSRSGPAPKVTLP